MGKFISLLAGLVVFGAFSSSSHYQLQSFSVGSGGSNSTASTTYHAQVQTGEITGTKTLSTTYNVKSGSISAQQANVPGAPTLSNGSGTYYSKLNFILDTGNNPTDATFTVQVATNSGFTSPSYVQADGTLGSSPVFQDYTTWGGSGGSFATSLTPNTTYYFRVAAMTGQFTESAFGPSANIATVNPSLSFSLSPNNLNLGNLNAGSIVTSSTITTTFSTNAYNGGWIYLSGSNVGLVSTATSYTIKVGPPNGDLSSLSEGFGAQSQTANGGVSAQSPYASSGNIVGSIYTSFVPFYLASAPVSSSTETLNVQAKASNITPSASDYTNTLTFVAAASY